MTDIRIGQPPTAPVVPPRRRRWPLIAAIAAAAVIIAAGLVAGGIWLAQREKAPVAAAPAAEEPIHVQGNLVLEDREGWHKDGKECIGDGGYDDIHAGTQVVVRDQSGTTIGVGSLIAGRETGGQCWFYFNVDVPAGLKFYSVEISHRGEVSYSAEDVKHPLWVSLG